MKAVLKDGLGTIDYDKVVTVQESHPTDPTVKVELYQFSRGTLGIVAIVPTRKVESLQ